MNYSVTLPSGCVAVFDCDCDEYPGPYSEVVGLAYYVVEDEASCAALAALRSYTHYQYTGIGEELPSALGEDLNEEDDDDGPGYRWGNGDTLIALLAVLGDPEAWAAAGEPETVTINVQSESEAFWIFHDVAHARLHWSVATGYDGGAVYAPAELEAWQEYEAHELGIRLAAAAGYGVGESLGVIFSGPVQAANLERFHESIPPSAILSAGVVEALRS